MNGHDFGELAGRAVGAGVAIALGVFVHPVFFLFVLICVWDA